jgi:hypothetical protein
MSAFVRPPPAGGPRGRRGVALLIVMIGLTLMAVTVLEFHENARSKLALAVNARDEVRAYYAARSSMNLTRLALKFQYELADTGGLIGQAVERSNFQLWQYLPLFLPTFFTGEITSPVGSLDLEETGAVGFGEFAGSADPPIVVPEEGKLNLNAFSQPILEMEVLLELCSLFAPPQYDPLFSESPGDPLRPTRGELIGAIIDYVDPDEDMITLDENCQVQSAGLGAEDRRYEELGYKSKNEAFVTLDEVLAVAGMNEQILDTFRDNLTVYAVSDRFFVNLADARSFMGFLCSKVLGAEGLNACRNPQIAIQIAYLALALEGWNAFFSSPYALLDYYLGFSSGRSESRVEEGIAAGQMIGFRTEQDFLTVLNLFLASPETASQYALLADPQRAALFGLIASGGQGFGFPRFTVAFDEAAITQRISVNTPRVFTITVTGRYGAAQRTITAVADYNQNGRLLYWREY